LSFSAGACARAGLDAAKGNARSNNDATTLITDRIENLLDAPSGFEMPPWPDQP
jgi:hypothetical protein